MFKWAVFMVVLILLLGSVLVFAEAQERTIQIKDSKNGGGSITLGDPATPFPSGGYSFIVNVTLSGSTQDLFNFQVAVCYEYSKVKCAGAWLPKNDPNFVFYGKQIVPGGPTIYNEQPRKAPQGYGYVVIGASPLNWNEAVTTSQAILCQINFTAIKTGTTSLNIIPTGSPDYGDDTFLWNSDLSEIPFSTQPFQITVYGAKSPPVAAFTWQPQNPKPNQTVTFDASESYDPDGEIVSYHWDFGDGTNTTTTEQKVNHTYTTYGIKYVSLTVTDNDNQNNTITQAVLVGVLPQVSFTYDWDRKAYPENPYQGIEITFNASESFDPDGNIIQYLWNFTRLQFQPKGVKINYIPVEFWNETTTNENVTFTPPKNGIYNVTLTAFDNDGLYNSTSKTILVGIRPTANFTWTPTQPMPDQEVTFNAYGTETERYTYDQDGIIVYAIWDFYGEKEETQMQAKNITKPEDLVTSFTYHTQGGNFTVTLTVIDDDGLYSSVSHTISVTVITVWDNIPPIISDPWQDPPADNVQPFQDVTVWVNVTDYGTGVKNVTLWYSLDNGATWTILNMTALPIPSDTTITYQAIIPGCEANKWVTYKIVAFDNAGNNATKDKNGFYYKYYVVPEFPSTIILSLFLVLIAIATIIAKKRLPKQSHSN